MQEWLPNPPDGELRCAWVGCETLEIVARGLCQKHYSRAKKLGIRSEFSAAERKCGACGDRFSTGKNGKHSYCSRVCQRQAVSKRRLERREVDLARTCKTCGGSFGAEIRADAQYCSSDCQQADWYALHSDALVQKSVKWKRCNKLRVRDYEHKRNALKRGCPVGKVDLSIVWSRDNGICWICEVPVDDSLKYPDPHSLSWDHVIPLSKGGGHVMDNLAVSHLRCNVKKHARILDRGPSWAS